MSTVTVIMLGRIVGSKVFCQTEEDKMIDETSDSDGGEEDFQAQCSQQDDKQDNKQANKVKVKKTQKKKGEKEEFILRTGRVPMRSIPLNVCESFPLILFMLHLHNVGAKFELG